MPHPRHISLEALLRVHAQLGDLAASALFVGACVRDTLLDDPERPRPAPASSAPPLVHAAWRNAASIGNYHSQFIRDCYACRRLA